MLQAGILTSACINKVLFGVLLRRYKALGKSKIHPELGMEIIAAYGAAEPARVI